MVIQIYQYIYRWDNEVSLHIHESLNRRHLQILIPLLPQLANNNTNELSNGRPLLYPQVSLWVAPVPVLVGDLDETVLVCLALLQVCLYQLLLQMHLIGLAVLVLYSYIVNNQLLYEK